MDAAFAEDDRRPIAILNAGGPNPPEPSAASVAALPDGALHFRTFTLLPGARVLLRDGEPVEIGSRAFDLLHILLRSRGALVERADIIRHVWPTTVVEESNVRFQVACLRKALGPDRDLLKTVPGRGYLLAAEPGAEAAPPGPSGSARAQSYDARGDELCGEELRTLLRQVLEELRRLTGGASPGV
ncbi:transcriptional regulator [Phenylobacterium terrae]|uniref:Transcriptional regulator n=1 Tax=Phenylobacterium terrae TaxID=2665495 RepID=A0ABW4N9U8_9CAUL